MLCLKPLRTDFLVFKFTELSSDTNELNLFANSFMTQKRCCKIWKTLEIRNPLC